MKELNKYYLKLTTLSPVHIGTGEVYEPTNFVIDDGWLYKFDEVLFYKSLTEIDRKALSTKLNDWMQIIDFYKKHIEQAKKIYENKVNVTKKVENKYKTTLNKDGTKNKNQFEIHTIFKNPNTYRAIIPGSSIKGMLDTVFKIYPPKASNEIRQNLIVSDALLVDGGTEIGYCYRKHKNPSKHAKSNIPQMVEIIKENSTFVLSIATDKSFNEIKLMMKNFHNERQDSRYQESINSFVARIGKYSGKEYMVDSGVGVKNSFGKPVATHTVYENNSPFGWVDFEKINFDDYEEFLQNIDLQEKSYFEQKESRQKKILQAIQKAEQEAKQKVLEKQKAREEEERRRKKEQEEKAAKLAAMSPLDRKIEKLIESHPNPNDSIDIIILNAIKDGKLEEFKCDALKRLKKEMQKLKRWVESSKKPEKDKKFKRTQEVINMLKECK